MTPWSSAGREATSVCAQHCSIPHFHQCGSFLQHTRAARIPGSNYKETPAKMNCNVALMSTCMKLMKPQSCYHCAEATSESAGLLFALQAVLPDIHRSLVRDVAQSFWTASTVTAQRTNWLSVHGKGNGGSTTATIGRMPGSSATIKIMVKLHIRLVDWKSVSAHIAKNPTAKQTNVLLEFCNILLCRHNARVWFPCCTESADRQVDEGNLHSLSAPTNPLGTRHRH